jgi:hypothetical protein
VALSFDEEGRDNDDVGFGCVQGCGGCLMVVSLVLVGAPPAEAEAAAEDLAAAAAGLAEGVLEKKENKFF